MLAFSAQYPRRVSRAYLFAPGEAVESKGLHISGFIASQDQLGHPLSNERRKFETVPTDTKLLFAQDFLTLQRLIRYSNMKKNELPALLFCCELLYDTLSEHS